jgi:hypothetical protein
MEIITLIMLIGLLILIPIMLIRKGKKNVTKGCYIMFILPEDEVIMKPHSKVMHRKILKECPVKRMYIMNDGQIYNSYANTQYNEMMAEIRRRGWL